MDDRSFLDSVSDRLAGLPTVVAVSLGGSRATGTNGPDSDWDLAIYYRGVFDPDHLRALGWPGMISEIGGWGGGVFNGGAWLEIERRRVDVHYRDIDAVEHELAEARQGRFRIEPLLFHLAGVPSYLVVAELALNRVLRGSMPCPEYPSGLREAAPRVWRDRAELTLDYAKTAYASSAKLTELAGALATAAAMTAHAVLAAREEWVTNEKRLLERAGLRDLDAIVANLRPDASALEKAVDRARVRFQEALHAAGV